MARTSNRRWKGCPLCKPKHAAHGQAHRKPVAEPRRLGESAYPGPMASYTITQPITADVAANPTAQSSLARTIAERYCARRRLVLTSVGHQVLAPIGDGSDVVLDQPALRVTIHSEPQ